MGRNYRSITPVQQFDPTSCWAAALEWWARAIGRGRPIITQLNLLNVYVSRWDSSNPDTNPNYGTVSRANLIAIIRDPRWRMDFEAIRGSSFSCRYLNTKMRRGPCILGYFESEVGGNHVVASYGASNTHVAVMDPNRARFRGHRVGHFTSVREIIVGYPR